LELTQRLLTQYHELRDITKNRTRNFAISIYRFMRTPGYDHAVMLNKIRYYGEPLQRAYAIIDYLFALEDIYKPNKK